MKLSAVILTKNEEKNIKRAIESVGFADEIIVIDDYSEDDTVNIAGGLGANVYKRRLEGDFATQRNFGLDKAKNEWTLFIDADEVVTKNLAREVEEVLKKEQDRKVGYYIKRRDFFWRKELHFGEVSRVRNKGLIRLVKKDGGRFVHAVHEVFKVQGSVGRLNSFLDHFPHPTIKEFLEDINFYSSLRTNQLLKEGKRGSFFEILAYPPSKFFFNYFIKGGFMDGPAGFTYAFLMSFHSYLVRAKLYQYTRLKR